MLRNCATYRPHCMCQRLGREAKSLYISFSCAPLESVIARVTLTDAVAKIGLAGDGWTRSGLPARLPANVYQPPNGSRYMHERNRTRHTSVQQRHLWRGNVWSKRVGCCIVPVYHQPDECRTGNFPPTLAIGHETERTPALVVKATNVTSVFSGSRTGAYCKRSSHRLTNQNVITINLTVQFLTRIRNNTRIEGEIQNHY
ncbi:hypothetical protein CSKR_108624 [Clonorchis sinensis]|uniref:Uncharacterized protein n=2 Tax=Clonorchis sinensis TaxID=79923 RepID=G7YVB7_CLOSI|nr:hypothetical protein CSKR_108624 [Clonorchis sinensis]GAA56897.1 hypothetical protein CLF_111777 [Clonorchis sinensis]